MPPVLADQGETAVCGTRATRFKKIKKVSRGSAV